MEQCNPFENPKFRRERSTRASNSGLWWFSHLLRELRVRICIESVGRKLQGESLYVPECRSLLWQSWQALDFHYVPRIKGSLMWIRLIAKLETPYSLSRTLFASILNWKNFPSYVPQSKEMSMIRLSRRRCNWKVSPFAFSFTACVVIGQVPMCGAHEVNSASQPPAMLQLLEQWKKFTAGLCSWKPEFPEFFFLRHFSSRYTFLCKWW